MKDIMGKLHQDHINAAKLLDLYEKQYLILKQGGAPDFLIMRDIMKYMNCYPDVVHHPLEEIIFEKLENKDDSLNDIINQLYKEHTEIDDIGDKLADKLSTISAGEVSSLADFLENSEKYIQLMRAHMNLEEGEVFPKIMELLTRDDWEAIDVTLAKQEDPVFGNKVDEEYQNLYDSVISRA